MADHRDYLDEQYKIAVLDYSSKSQKITLKIVFYFVQSGA